MIRCGKAFIVLNPSAGRCSVEAVRSSVARHIDAAGISHRIHETGSGERIEATVGAAVRAGCDLVVAAGGDGTVSAAMAGVARTAVPLGIVPIGTTNLIARELGVPLDVDEAVRLVAAGGSTRLIDGMGIAGRSYFLQVGVGVSATVVEGTTPAHKSRFGVLAYLGTALRRFFEIKPRSIEVTVDGTTHRAHSIEAAVANNGILAAMFFRRGPDVRMDDGHIDVCILVTRTLLDYPRLFLNVIAGRAVTPHVIFLAAERSVAIRGTAPLPVQADGDLIGVTPLEIEVMPRAVRVIAPEAVERELDGSLARNILLDPYIAGLVKKRLRGRTRLWSFGERRGMIAAD